MSRTLCRRCEKVNVQFINVIREKTGKELWERGEWRSDRKGWSGVSVKE